MEATAYWIALVTVITVPPFALLWLVVHPFARQWRKLGPAKAYPILLGIAAAVMPIIFHFRQPLLRVHFGVSWPLTALAVTLLVTSKAIGFLRFGRLPPLVLLGLPQLSPRRYPGKVITSGIYAHIRHPRYVEVGLSLAAIALFTNYLATYVLAAAYIPVIYLIVVLEERELKERFGGEYEEYSRRVPRFLPRLGRQKKHRA